MYNLLVRQKNRKIIRRSVTGHEYCGVGARRGPGKNTTLAVKVHDENTVGPRKKNTNDITRRLRQFVSQIIVVSHVILPTVITVLVRSSLSIIKIKNRYKIHGHTPFVKQLSTRRTNTK